jgi:hypothetical protein
MASSKPVSPGLLITAAALQKCQPCEDQIDLFRKTFPKGVLLTLANLRRAAMAGLNLDWFVQYFCTAPAEKAFQEATDTAWKAFQEAKATAVWTAIRLTRT